MASPTSEVLRTALPRAARSASTARSTRAASSVRPKCSRSMPTATILSVGMLLEHLGRSEEAARVERAVETDLAARGSAVRSTPEVGDAIASLL